MNGLSTTVFKAAPAALRIDGAGIAVQKLEGVSGRAIIRIKGWMKTEGSARAQVAVQGYAQGFAQNVWKQLIYAQGDTDWTLFDKEIELPAWTWFCELKFLVEGDGRAWLDEIE